MHVDLMAEAKLVNGFQPPKHTKELKTLAVQCVQGYMDAHRGTPAGGSRAARHLLGVS
jgi:hypothetical protein